MSLLYVKFFFLILSLSAALFCHATATSSVAEFEVEVSCPKPEEGRPTPTPCFCPAQKVDTSYGMFHFPKTEATYAGTVTVAPCPYGVIDLGLEPLTPFYVKAVTEAPESGAKRICRLKSNLENGELSNTAVWELDVEPEPKRCRSTSTFDGLRSMNKAVENFEITPYNYKAMWPKFLLVKFWATYPPGDYEAARTLIDALGNLLNSYNRYEEKLDPSAARQCFAMLDDFTKEVPLNPGYRITVPSSHVTVQTAQFPYTSNESAIMNYSAIIDNVQLKFPSDILRMSLMQNVVQPKLRVLAFSEELFILWKHEIEAIPSTTTTRSIVIPEHSTSTTVAPISPDLENNTGLAGRWRVFQVDVLDAAITNLTSEFEYTFQPENEDEIQNYTWKCVFYDEEGNWSSKGMTSLVNKGNITCKATHFTAFSVLIDPLPLPIPGSDYAPIQNSVHSNILSILSSIGSAISIVGLAGVILTYGLFRCLRRERSNRILLNLSVSLFMMHLISISSGKELWHNKCLVPSVLLQYFLHTSLFWMLMEAMHMYQLLISVFVKPEKRFLTKRCLAAWGIPLVIVSICAAVRPEVYYTGRHDVCIIAAHLNLPLYYIAYMAPIIIILIVNLGVFCRIFNVLYKQTVKQRSQEGPTKCKSGVRERPHDEPENLSKKVAENLRKTKYVMLSPTQIKGSITVMILVGAGWVVGLFAIGPFEVFFKYLFCITNAGQGALIFLFRVILHPQACREWRKAVLGLNIDALSEASTTSTTNINNSKAKGFVSTSPGFISASNSVENSLTPSNPDAKDLALTLASMLHSSKDPLNNNRF